LTQPYGVALAARSWEQVELLDGLRDEVGLERGSSWIVCFDEVADRLKVVGGLWHPADRAA
jgi:hypothetical protein